MENSMIGGALLKQIFLPFLLAGGVLFSCAYAQAPGRPQLGKPADGPVIDKSGDKALAQLIAEIAPQFSKHEFKGSGHTLAYNLFTPKNMETGKKYPLVLFIADASTPGRNMDAPLIQGYGALVWATAKAQEKNPCFVLAPQFSGVAVNDAYEHTEEVDEVIALLKDLAGQLPIDPARLYVTGQSMGGMIGMFYNIAYPEVFAASLFVDCHWDASRFPELAAHPFIFIYAGHKGKAWKSSQEIEEACRKERVGYTWSEWSARLPLPRQDELAATQLEKGQPINLMGFEDGTVLPEDGKGSEHMYSFDHAYQLTPVREWLFKHALAAPGIEKTVIK